MTIDVEQYFRTYGPMVMRRCRQMLKDEDDAADAMQDTFVRLLNYRDQLQNRAPSSLIYTIATNVCLNRLRSQSRDRRDCVGELIDLFAMEDDRTDAVLDTVVTEEIIGSFSGRTRRMAVDYFIEGKTLAETAARHRMSVSGVRKRLIQVREHGRRVLAA